MQSRLHSFLESVANVIIGYLVAVIAQVVFFPLFDIRVSLSDNLALGALFTIVSFTRSYALRRWFNGMVFK